MISWSDDLILNHDIRFQISFQWYYSTRFCKTCVAFNILSLNDFESANRINILSIRSFVDVRENLLLSYSTSIIYVISIVTLYLLHNVLRLTLTSSSLRWMIVSIESSLEWRIDWDNMRFSRILSRAMIVSMIKSYTLRFNCQTKVS